LNAVDVDGELAGVHLAGEGGDHVGRAERRRLVYVAFVDVFERTHFLRRVRERQLRVLLRDGAARQDVPEHGDARLRDGRECATCRIDRSQTLCTRGLRCAELYYNYGEALRFGQSYGDALDKYTLAEKVGRSLID